MKSRQYLEEIRQAAGLARAVLRKIEVKGRTATFFLVTDKTYSAEDVEYARNVSGRYVPEGFAAEVNVRKSVPDPEGIRRAVAEKNLRAARKNVPPFVADDLEHFIDPEPFHLVKENEEHKKKVAYFERRPPVYRVF